MITVIRFALVGRRDLAALRPEALRLRLPVARACDSQCDSFLAASLPGPPVDMAGDSPARAADSPGTRLGTRIIIIGAARARRQRRGPGQAAEAEHGCPRLWLLQPLPLPSARRFTVG